MRVIMLLVCAAALCAQADPLRNGVENAVKVGETAYVIYLPKRYTKRKKWPVIVWYHARSKPNTAFLRAAGCSGRYVLVGAQYVGPDGGLDTYAKHQAYIAREVVLVRALVKDVDARVAIDTTRRYVGGFSRGGNTASFLFEGAPELWAGALVLGGFRGTGNPRMPDAIKGKRMYFGIGSKDEHVGDAQRDSKRYQAHGCEVTLELWQGLGHRWKPSAYKLRQWLRK